MAALNAAILQRFDGRHRHFRQMLERQFERWRRTSPTPAAVSAARRLLIGAYFTHEYAVEAAALFNPSIVPAPDQSGVANGSQRFVMSLRAVGEGHLSSIEFRSGVLDADAGLTIDAPGTNLVGGQRTAARLLQENPLHHQAARARRRQRSLVERHEPAWRRSSRSRSSKRR